MTLNEYQQLSRRTLPTGTPMGLANYAMGLTGESGEVVDHIKKHVFHGHKLDKAETMNELGDTLHYLSGIASMIGCSLEDIAVMNIEKLKRRYPNGFSKEDSINREY